MKDNIIIFEYYGFTVCKDFIFSFIFFLNSIIFPFIGKQPYGLILSFLIFIFLGRKIYIDFRNLYRYLKKLPAIELTKTYYRDESSKIKIRWDVIDKITIEQRRDSHFLIFQMADKYKIYYFQQIKNPFSRYFNLLFYQLSYIQTNVSGIKGKNDAVFKTINEYFLKESRKI